MAAYRSIALSEEFFLNKRTGKRLIKGSIARKIRQSARKAGITGRVRVKFTD